MTSDPPLASSSALAAGNSPPQHIEHPITSPSHSRRSTLNSLKQSPPLPPRSPVRPAGPRPNTPDRKSSRDQPGSSRTQYHVPNPRSPIATSSTTIEQGNFPPYRSPEPVYDPPEDMPPGYGQGVIEEHMLSDDEDVIRRVTDLSSDEADMKHKWGKTSNQVNAWQASVDPFGMDVDVDERIESVEKPQLGWGSLPRRLILQIHEHELVQPEITTLPQPLAKPLVPSTLAPSEASSSQASDSTSQPATVTPVPPVPEHIATIFELWDACPGGIDHHQEWFFCPTCWGWLRIQAGRGVPDLLNMEQWAMVAEHTEKERGDRLKEWSKYNDLLASRMLSPRPRNHYHEFTTLLMPSTNDRIPRINVDESMDAFPHKNMGLDPEDPSWETFTEPVHPARLFLSCSSNVWVTVDKGLVPGQLPLGLVSSFNSEKMSNPAPGISAQQSVVDAWALLHTLLANPLFKQQRGWVRLDNKKFTTAIGMSLASSNLLYQLGFGCRQDSDYLRVGPFKQGDGISKEEVEQMDRYMLRAYVEIGLFLNAAQQKYGILPRDPLVVRYRTLTEILGLDFGITFDLSMEPYPDAAKPACKSLGTTVEDGDAAQVEAYELQIACDVKNTKYYMTALDEVYIAARNGQEVAEMQTKLALERSLGKYTLGDLNTAYDKIGYTMEHASMIAVEATEAPEDYLLDLHKTTVQAATAAQRGEISQALLMIGRDRNSEAMIRLGESGQTHMSVNDAFAAFNAPRDSVDEGLIMQYEMAVGEFPGKTEHYRMCLGIIADAPGAERPGLKTFLETGVLGPAAPIRQDIPVGLQNIGNTCYLNSILQYLYSIKPLREAVMTFEQNLSGPKTPHKPEVERSKRFVRQLRLLFLQLYKSEQSAVRPDEELAYLAITRPEVDEIIASDVVRPLTPTRDSTILPPLDSIPNIPSPSSTCVATPFLSPTEMNTSLPPSPSRSRSVLGKRASQDREDSVSPVADNDRSRIKSDGFEHVESPMELDGQSLGDFEMIENVNDDDRTGRHRSPSTTTEIAALRLKSLAVDSPVLDGEKVDEGLVPPPLPPRPAVVKQATLASGLQFGLQQDSAEVLINVLTQLELAFDPSAAEEGSEPTNLIQRLFSCKYRQQLSYQLGDGTMEDQPSVESVFVHPIIGVEEEGKDLYDCLGELYLKGADVEYEGKKGNMMDLMDEFPPMLYIQMRRSQYDMATGRERKTNTHIGFQQVLSMDRFLVNAVASLRAESIVMTREIMNVRSRLHQLKNNKPLSIPRTFEHVAEALETLDVSTKEEMDVRPDFLNALRTEGEAITKEIQGLEEQLPDLKRRLDELWKDRKEFEYELVAVFMHRGKTSGAGHYWTYQAHLPNNNDKFFKYNDEQVTEVPSTEVLADRTGSDANPALLCYVRRGGNLVDTLHREILEEKEVEGNLISL